MKESITKGFQEVKEYKRGERKFKSLEESMKMWDKLIEECELIEYFEVLTMPQNKLFMVKEDKADEFLNAKRDEEAFRVLMDRANIFRKNLNDK